MAFFTYIHMLGVIRYSWCSAESQCISQVNTFFTHSAMQVTLKQHKSHYKSHNMLILVDHELCCELLWEVNCEVNSEVHWEE